MAAAIALACHYFDEEDSASSTSSLLEGTWRGTLRVASDESAFWDDPPCILTDPFEPCVRDLGFDIDLTGMIADVLMDGVSTGYTGTTSIDPGGFSYQFARFYLFELVDAGGAPVATGSFYTDERMSGGIFTPSCRSGSAPRGRWRKATWRGSGLPPLRSASSPSGPPRP
jgi:hypothetical protein